MPWKIVKHFKIKKPQNFTLKHNNNILVTDKEKATAFSDMLKGYFSNQISPQTNQITKSKIIEIIKHLKNKKSPRARRNYKQTYQKSTRCCN